MSEDLNTWTDISGKVSFPDGAILEDIAVSNITMHDCMASPFFIRHARNIEMNNIELRLENEDSRPPFILEDVKGVSFFNVKASHGNGIPTFILKNVTDFKTV